MKHLTVRRVPDRLARALEAEKRSRGTSLNQTVLDLLAQALGTATAPRSTGLSALAGGWSAADLARFERNVAVTEQIDAAVWE